MILRHGIAHELVAKNFGVGLVGFFSTLKMQFAVMSLLSGS